MSKIYELYSPDQRKIDNLKRRIRGYQKMEKDLQRDIRKTNNKNRELQKRIDKVLESIKEYKEMGYSKYDENEIEIELIDKILEILGGENNR